jgi:repressor LexA
MSDNKLHAIQEKLLKILAKNSDEPLTIREMQEKVGASSTSVVVHHLTQLEKKRFIKKNPYNSKDYQILKQQDQEIAYINLYGMATCGPNGSVLDGDPIDKIPISSRLLSFSSSKAFMVKAKGDSMLPKISSGDFVIAQKASDADDGEIIVCVNDGKALIKKFKKEGKNKILISLNNEFTPFLASLDDFRIEGVVKGVITNKVL